MIEYYIKKSTNDKYEDIDSLISELAEKTNNYTGADLQSIVYNAFLISIQKAIENNDDKCKITKDDIDKAFLNFKPSLSKKDIQFYGELKHKLLNTGNTSKSDSNDKENNEENKNDKSIYMNTEINKLKTTLY